MTEPKDSSISQDQNKSSGTLDKGWYTLKEGVINGPIVTGALFYVNSTDENPILVSRKGFKNWYPIHEIERILIEEADIPRMVEDHLTELIDRQRRHTRKISKRPTSPVESKEIKKKLQIDTPERPFVDNSFARMLADETMGKSQEPLTGAEVEAPPESKEHKFLDLGKKLRLGTQRDHAFTVSAFVASLGLYLPFWLRKISKETLWHIYGSHERKIIPPLIFLFIPGLHFFYLAGLVRLISKMEAQNKYKKVSMTKTLICSLFPPLLMVYLQNILNYHWRGHIFTEINKQ